jgi:putative transposase
MYVYRQLFCVRLMAKCLSVSTSGYYRWLCQRSKSSSATKEFLVKKMTHIFLKSSRTYGSPRVHATLNKCGMNIGLNTVARLMRAHGLKAKMRRLPHLKRRFARRQRAGFADLVQRNFLPARTNQVWASDITFIWTQEGWLYLAVVLDLFSRKVIGYQMSHRLTKEITIEALKKAVSKRKFKDDLIHHSDQGFHYTCQDYQNYLRRAGIRPSFGRRGECWDNAVVESFFHTLKTELVYFQVFNSRQQALSEVSEWIDEFYNKSRLHSTLGYRSPIEYEAMKVS